MRRLMNLLSLLATLAACGQAGPSVSMDVGSTDAADDGATCSRAPGQSCQRSSDCCASAGAEHVCENVYGRGRICTARCSSPSDCQTQCCVRYEDGVNACAERLMCYGGLACSVNVEGTCRIDEQCCKEVSSRVPSACTCFGAECSCRRLCRDGTECLSGCCSPRGDGLKVCAPSTACR